MKFIQSPYHDLSMYRGAPASSISKAKALRNNMTPAEQKLWGYLKNNQFDGYRFRRQHPIHIYIVDFYCHEIGLIIEVDGDYHNGALQTVKDLDRSDLLQFQGLHVIRFSNERVMGCIEEVLEDLKQFILNLSPGPGGRLVR